MKNANTVANGVFSYTQTVSTDIFDGNYSLTTTSALVLTENPNSSVEATSSGVSSTANVSYYNIISAKTNVPLTTKALYAHTARVNEVQYTHWEKASDDDVIVADGTTNVTTDEIGVFINNKKSVSETEDGAVQELAEDTAAIQESADRLFTIASVINDGSTISYQNILSVLKNGVLYIGGTIGDEYGKALNIQNLGYLPDKVRISESNFMVANDGRIFCKWDKMFRINEDYTLDDQTSLMDALANIGSSSGSSSSGSSSGLSSGYYLIDPLS